jgi:hypothetical protein
MGGRHSESIFGTIPPYMEVQRKARIKAKSTGFRTKILKLTSQIRCRIYYPQLRDLRCVSWQSGTVAIPCAYKYFLCRVKYHIVKPFGEVKTRTQSHSNFGARQLHDHAAFLQEQLYSLDEELVGRQSRSGRDREGIVLCPWTLNLRCSDHITSQ